jgi:hypothetical protein
MALTNTTKPSTTFTNASKASDAELWSTIATTWASETRTWDQCISLFDNTGKPTTAFTNTAKP